MPKRTDISKILIIGSERIVSLQPRRVSAILIAAVAVLVPLAVGQTATAVPKVPSPHSSHDNIDGITISGLVYDVDTGKPYVHTSLGFEVTPVDRSDGGAECEKVGSTWKTYLVSVRTNEKGQYSMHLDHGDYKITFQLPGDRKFGCEFVTSREPDWCQQKSDYSFALQTSERFQGVIGTVNATRPCTQGIRPICEDLSLPYVLRSANILLVNEDRTPIRNAALVVSPALEMDPHPPKPKTVYVSEDGMADLTPVFKEFLGRVDLVIQEKEVSRPLRVSFSGDGNAPPQVVRVMQWKCPYKTGALWAAEITPLQN